MNNDQERIVAAAMVFDGITYTGSRHYRIIQDYKAMGGNREGSFKGRDGFYTSHKRFVDRKVAKDIALAAGQITKEHSGVLYSEDLWDAPETAVKELQGVGEFSLSNEAWMHAIAHASGNLDRAIDDVLETLFGGYLDVPPGASWTERQRVYSTNGFKKILRENYKKWKRGEVI